MKLLDDWGYPGLGMCTGCSLASIPDNEGEADVRVWNAALRDGCPIEKGLMVQLLHLQCDELLGIVGRR